MSRKRPGPRWHGGAYPTQHPGEFKTQVNRVGTQLFVAPKLVAGTLDEGYARYAELIDPFARAVFMMFMVSEVHPFDDGNGRLSRAMINAELWAAAQSPVLVPTVFCSDYSKSLRALSLHSRPRRAHRGLRLRATVRVRDRLHGR